MHIKQRKHIRYNEALLQINVSRPGIAGFLKFTPSSECMDFSLSGLQFGSSQAFKIGERLVIDLLVRDIELHEINAIVMNSKREENGAFCIGVKFCFEANRMKNPDIMHALLQIEDRFRVENEFPS